jgi:hypothetical protein
MEEEWENVDISDLYVSKLVVYNPDDEEKNGLLFITLYNALEVSPGVAKKIAKLITENGEYCVKTVEDIRKLKSIQLHFERAGIKTKIK